MITILHFSYSFTLEGNRNIPNTQYTDFSGLWHCVKLTLMLTYHFLWQPDALIVKSLSARYFRWLISLSFHFGIETTSHIKQSVPQRNHPTLLTALQQVTHV